MRIVLLCSEPVGLINVLRNGGLRDVPRIRYQAKFGRERRDPRPASQLSP